MKSTVRPGLSIFVGEGRVHIQPVVSYIDLDRVNKLPSEVARYCVVSGLK